MLSSEPILSVTATSGPFLPASNSTCGPVSSSVADGWRESSMNQAGDWGNQPVANTKVIAVSL